MAAPPPQPATFIQRLVVAWEKTQVELHGQYSLERLKGFHVHAHKVAGWKNTASYALTPIPCLVIVALLDCFKLEPADAGALKSVSYWLRLYVYGWACLIGFPVPFTNHFQVLPWAIIFAIDFQRTYGELPRRRPDVMNDVKIFLLLVNCQILQTFIYPVYASGFALLSSYAQTAFALLLPLIKLGAKNVINYVLEDLDDLKPELVIFNVEIFNALFVSLCMGNSTSILTTAVLIGVDLVQAWLSLHDMKDLVRDLNAMLDKMPLAGSALSEKELGHGRTRQRQRRHDNIVDAAIEILQLDSQISRHASLQEACRFSTLKKQISAQSSVPVDAATKVAKKSSSLAHSKSAIAPASTDSTDTVETTGRVMVTPLGGSIKQPCSAMPARDPAPTPADDVLSRTSTTNALALNQADEGATTKLGLDALERLQFVQKTTKVLYMTEYAVLVEYTEVVTPLIYCSYMLLMYYLPNREYYPQIAQLSQAAFFGNLKSVLLYASLELVSFLGMTTVIKRQIGITRTDQLGFVLMNQWRAVQSKFIIWVVYIPQLYLCHFGVDFTFQFKWLSTQPTPSK